MADAFSPISIKGMVLRNRFMRSATHDGTAHESGMVTEKSLSIYRALGEGDIGLIVSGYAFISTSGQVLKNQYGAHTDEMIASLKKMVEAVHSKGGKIALQIVHAGANSPYLADRGIMRLAPSRVESSGFTHCEMTAGEIEAIIRDFGAAAARAREAGFDAVQLHGAHGYLLSQFLSPLTNKRADIWGGSLENRCRFHIEVIKEVRLQAGHDFPLLIKLGIMDDEAGGTTLAEGIAAAEAMVKAGVDGIEVSAGIGGDFFRRTIGKECVPGREEPFFHERTLALKRRVSVPVALVGGIRSLQMAQRTIDTGKADIVSMSRPFIREPGLVKRWAAGDQRPAQCITCNQCHRLLWTTDVLGNYCWQESRSKACRPARDSAR